MISVFSMYAFADTHVTAPDSGNHNYLIDDNVIFEPTTTMLKENSGLLFTILLIGIALGTGDTLLVQHIRRKKK